MNNKAKYIGINQRIPFKVLDSAIHFYLENGKIDKDYIFQGMQEVTSGTNRANKAALYVIQILKRQLPILNLLKKAMNESSFSTLRMDDRRALCLCLICLTYPITYDLLGALAQGFKVQKQINKKFISEKVKNIYGSNRTVDIAIDALVPMIIELNTIKRVKINFYSLGTKLVVKNSFMSEFVIYTDIKLSGSKSILIDDLNFKPWYIYFDISSTTIGKLKLFIGKKESAIGKGYLTIVS